MILYVVPRFLSIVVGLSPYATVAMPQICNIRPIILIFGSLTFSKSANTLYIPTTSTHTQKSRGSIIQRSTALIHRVNSLSHQYCIRSQPVYTVYSISAGLFKEEPEEKQGLHEGRLGFAPNYRKKNICII
jgi:hypothetical protein